MSTNWKLAFAATVAASTVLSVSAQEEQRGSPNQSNAQSRDGKQKQNIQKQRASRDGQAQRQGNGNAAATVIALSEWNYDELYDKGWTADRLIGAAVFGPDGEEIGEIENLLLDEQSEIVAVIAEVGGFWDIGDTHVAVPWSRIRVEGTDDYKVHIPVTEDTVEQYSIYADEYYSKFDVGVTQQVADDVSAGPQIWKATDLLDDYVLLENGDEYGYVNDLVFDTNGDLLSVLVNPSAGYGTYGYYAYPWYGYGVGWTPMATRYTLPYTRAEIAGLTAFDYDNLDGAIRE